MTEHTRYAVYHMPPPGPLAETAARWLGWDALTAWEPPPLALPGLLAPPAELTQAPRKYGFHATLRAPFHPAEGLGASALDARLADLAARLAPVHQDGLEIAPLGAFLALRPIGSSEALDALAAAVVEGTNTWRAPLSPADRARRAPDRLTERQRILLDTYGYPFVLEQFRFHMTLTGRLSTDDQARVLADLRPLIEPLLPTPYPIADLCLVGERADGRFELLSRHPLTG